jgi:hypothetical protein
MVTVVLESSALEDHPGYERGLLAGRGDAVLREGGDDGGCGDLGGRAFGGEFSFGAGGSAGGDVEEDGDGLGALRGGGCGDGGLAT